MVAKGKKTTKSNIEGTIYLASLTSKVSKMVSVSITGIIGLVLILYVGSYVMERNLEEQDNYHLLQERSMEILLTSLQMRRHEKAYLLTYQSEEAEEYDQAAAKVLVILNEMKKSPEADGLSKSMTRMHEYIQQHVQQFELVRVMINKIGVSENNGLRADIRTNFKPIEEYVRKHNNYYFLAQLLQMRRTEKDFLLRKDKKYLGQMTQLAKFFHETVESSDVSPMIKNRIQLMTRRYRILFSDLGATMLELEAAKKKLDDIYKDFSLIYSQVDDFVKEQIKVAREQSEQNLHNLKLIVGMLSLLLVLITAGIGIVIVRRVGRLLR